MARPETESKTIFGKRLRYVRLALGDPSREALAKSFSMTKNSIAFYERGEREPNLNVLQTYRTLYGVNINWLLTGQGKMFDAEYMKSDFDWNYFIKKIEGLEEILTKSDHGEKLNQKTIDSSYKKLQQYLSKQGLSNSPTPKAAISLFDMKAKMANSYTLSLFIDLLIRSMAQQEIIANQ
ncbi:helix-turn-helix domain-containing protein [Bartonella machadoae]|uniref:helix-turn-helix domain-containing protein n=1 Tax=Bartonella machadoae TaxID=2893471 RepID=UPI001F4CFA16|nr:helix-turn-helix transcriptional regulator [Bartonella machadoae]UNE53694.1 helix-turn-helix domain-containing protein [Bartonella machadoae]